MELNGILESIKLPKKLTNGESYPVRDALKITLIITGPISLQNLIELKNSFNDPDLSCTLTIPEK